jgi:membrane protease YdiL (CAAX protease family)
LTARDAFVGADGRARWFWRLALFAVAVAAAVFLLLGITEPLLAGVYLRAGERLIVQEWVLLLGVLLAHLLLLRFVERRGWGWVGLDRHAARPAGLLHGVAIGALAIGLPSLLLLATRWLCVVPMPDGSWGGAAYSLAMTLAPAAMWEELMFRGYPFAVLREQFGPVAAIGATSILFGLLHVGNPGVTPLAITMVVVAGIFLGAILLATRSLWATWAAHFAWNWTMAALFHMEVSGGGFPTPDYRVVEVGPDWLTGGGWGPEGGLAALVGMTTAMLYLRVRARRAPTDADDVANTLARPIGREER